MQINFAGRRNGAASVLVADSGREMTAWKKLVNKQIAAESCLVRIADDALINAVLMQF